MLRKQLVALAAVVVALVAVATPAFAHVVVEPSTATVGAEQTFVFRVPNEIDSSSTVKLEVEFPPQPITGVEVEPVPGWTATVQQKTLATPIKTDDGPVSQVVSEITWAGGKIGTGQFQRFPWVGTLPDTPGVLVFPAIQTYANGTVVSWIQPIVAGQPEPANPTPTLTVTNGSAATGSTAPSATTTPAAAPVVATPGASKSSVTTADALGAAGLVCGLIGLALGLVALTRKPRPANTA